MEKRRGSQQNGEQETGIRSQERALKGGMRRRAPTNFGRPLHRWLLRAVPTAHCCSAAFINNCITSHCLCARVGLCNISPAKPSRFIPGYKVEVWRHPSHTAHNAGSSLPHYLRNIRKHESCDDDGLETCQPSPQNSPVTSGGLCSRLCNSPTTGLACRPPRRRETPCGIVSMQTHTRLSALTALEMVVDFRSRHDMSAWTGSVNTQTP